MQTLRMPGVKRNRDFSDNDEADHYSDSDHSSEDDFAQSDGSESEESSELDEQECDIRRHIYATDVGDLERQFVLLREQLYRERMLQVEERLSAVRSGEASEYLAPLNQLEEAYNIRLEVAEVSRQFRIRNIQTKHEAELIAAKQNYENEKVLEQWRLREELQEKVKRLQEDRHTVALTSSLWVERNLKKSNRSQRREKGTESQKPVTVDGPYIVYSLREEDILEDWTAIRRAVQASKQRRSKWSWC